MIRPLTKNWLATFVLIVTAVLSSPPLAAGADHVVVHDENIPCVLWCRGCAPTAGTMVLGYWDRGDADFEWSGYGNLIDFWREYSLYSTGSGSMRNVPNLLEELRIAMKTNSSGGTYTSEIGDGIEYTCNDENGYTFDSIQTECESANDWCWEKIKSEINHNRPFVWSVGTNEGIGHSVAAWGYTDAKYVITYNTWNCPGRDDWYYKKYNNGSYIDWGYVDTAVPGGGTLGQTSLTWPDGGETLIAGKAYDIIWYESDDKNDKADIEYSLDGGVTWQAIDTVEPSGSGSQTYAWTVPDQSATKARVRITSYSNNDGDWTVQAGDGSEANFSIEQDQTAPTPNPMTFSSAPHNIDTAQIEMSATTASDSFGPVEYLFECYGSTTCEQGGDDSGWQAESVYIDDGLETNLRYGYRVSARDGSPAQNPTSTSNVHYVYTDIETPTGISYGTITNSSIAVQSANTPSGLTRGNSGLWVECFLQDNSGWKQNNLDWIQTGLAVNTIYMFRAKARNGDADETDFCDWGDGRYTLANVPAEAVISNATLTTMDVTITENGNPADTACRIRGYDVGDGSYFYLSAAGEKVPFENGGQWQSIFEWGTTTVSGLTPNTTYEFSVMARNGDGIATDWSTPAKEKTNKEIVNLCAGDYDDDGDVDGHDLFLFPGGADLSFFADEFGRTNCFEE